jgi:uncharacterized protein YbaP (TraB family)
MKARSNLRLRGALALSAALMLASSGANAAEVPTPPSHPALWRVTHGPATVYLFGSLHVLPANYAWTTPAIDAAKAASDRFMFEVPVDDAALQDEKQFIIANGLLARSQTLRGLLSGTEFQTYSTVLRRAGMKPEQFERFRPWLAAVVLGLAYLHSEDLNHLRGADDELMDFARGHSRPLLYLESVRDQMQLLTRGDPSDQLKALKSLIVTLPRSKNQEKELLTIWASGNATGLTALLEGYFRGHAEAHDLLISSRNRAWLPAIKEALARPGGATMLTVGAAHVGGNDGLIALLCRDGYAVEQLREVQTGENACGPES